MASNIPNWLNASDVELPYCFNVIGTSVSFALLKTDVTRLFRNIGTEQKINRLKLIEHLFLYFL